MLYISNISLIRDKVSQKCQQYLRPSAPLTGGEGGGGEAPVGRSGGGGGYEETVDISE